MKLSFFKNMGFFFTNKKKIHVARHMNFFFPSANFFSLFHYKKNFLNFFHSTWHMKKKFTVTNIKEHFISKQSYYLQKPWEGRELLFLHKKKNFHVLSCTKMIFSLIKNVFFPLFHTWKEHFRTSKKGPAEKKEILERNIFWRWIKRITFQAEWKKCFSSMKKKKNH